jgi:hypothetical protein
MLAVLLGVIVAVSDTVVFDNAYVRVTRDGSPCAVAATAGCGDRVVVAINDLVMGSRHMKRGDIAVYPRGESYQRPSSGSWFEVAFKTAHPPVQAAKEQIRPAKNEVLFENARLFIFEERLAVGDTRGRHSHNQRVVIQLNRTKLQQWPEGEPEIMREIEPDRPGFNPPVIHVVKNVGVAALRGIVIELKP